MDAPGPPPWPGAVGILGAGIDVRLLLENASDVIAVADGKAVVRYISPAVERTTGFTPAEVVGRSAFILIHPGDLAAARGAFLVAVRAERPATRLRR